MANAPASPFV